jgi:glutamyl-tRNA reductase
MSQLTILSVNHQQASITVREQVAFSASTLSDELLKLNAIKGIEACVILSTCNRSEIIALSSHADTQSLLSHYLAKTHQISLENLTPYLVYFEGNKAFNHLCQVATGLNSLVLGEPQILGQLKEAYQQSKLTTTLNKTLEKIFQHTFSVAKKVRTETQIGSSPVSVAYCAVKLSEKIFTDLSKQSVLLIGAGEMIELCAQYLYQKGVRKITVANRTLENAQKIATLYQANAVNLKQFSKIVPQADIIISSTAASVPIIGKGLIESALKKRKHRPIFMLDIAIPRDIEPEVGQLNDVYLYTVDDLQQVVNDNIGIRKQEKALAQKIINQQTEVFNNWLEKHPNEQLIKTYQIKANDVKKSLVDKALTDLEKGEDASHLIQKLADQLTNKLMHNPFQNIKQAPKGTLSQCQKCVPIFKS